MERRAINRVLRARPIVGARPLTMVPGGTASQGILLCRWITISIPHLPRRQRHSRLHHALRHRHYNGDLGILERLPNRVAAGESRRLK